MLFSWALKTKFSLKVTTALPCIFALMFSHQCVWPPFAAQGWACEEQERTLDWTGSQPSGWGSEELGGEENAGERHKSEPEDPSCFYRPASLLHWRYLRNLKLCCGICFWASDCRTCSGCPLLLWWGCWHSRTFWWDVIYGTGTLTLLGAAVCLQMLHSKGKLHFIMFCYRNWCRRARRLWRKYIKKDTVFFRGLRVWRSHATGQVTCGESSVRSSEEHSLAYRNTEISAQ